MLRRRGQHDHFALTSFIVLGIFFFIFFFLESNQKQFLKMADIIIDLLIKPWSDMLSISAGTDHVACHKAVCYMLCTPGSR